MRGGTRCHRKQQAYAIPPRQAEHLVQVDDGESVGILDVEAGVGDDEPLAAAPANYLRLKSLFGVPEGLDAFGDLEVHQPVDEAQRGAHG